MKSEKNTRCDHGQFQAIVGNGELDIAEISLADMDPEEIRAELRRAYTQLEVGNINKTRVAYGMSCHVNVIRSLTTWI